MSAQLADSDHYPAPAGRAEAELTIQRSRFLAIVCPVTDRESAQAELLALRTLHHRATHHCSAARLGHPLEAETWSSDDGEPSGSAGVPMLKEIQGSGLGDVLVVCVRWFGGVKLGTGGLVRAYGECTRAALQGLPRTTRVLRVPLTVRLPWAALTRVKRLLAELQVQEVGRRSAAEVELDLAVPRSLYTTCREGLLEILQGGGEVR